MLSQWTYDQSDEEDVAEEVEDVEDTMASMDATSRRLANTTPSHLMHAFRLLSEERRLVKTRALLQQYKDQISQTGKASSQRRQHLSQAYFPAFDGESSHSYMVRDQPAGSVCHVCDALLFGTAQSIECLGTLPLIFL